MLQPKLPAYDYSLVIRTDFSNDTAWESVCKAVQAPQTDAGFQASVECISDETCAGLSPEAVSSLLPSDTERSFMFLVDSETISQQDQPILVVSLEDPGQSFRVVPSTAWAVENNLRLANVSFGEFIASVGSDGVLRGIG